MNSCLVLAVATLLLGATGHARATTTLTCDIDDPAVTLSLQAAVGSLSIIGSMQGRFDLKGGGGWPKSGFDLTSESMLQQWLDGPDLRLRMHAPFDDPVEIELVLIARRSTEFDFTGRYNLKVFVDGKTMRRSGRVGCTLG